MTWGSNATNAPTMCPYCKETMLDDRADWPTTHMMICSKAPWWRSWRRWLVKLRVRDAIKARADKAEGLQKMIDGVKEEATAEGRGLWKPCTGCHESEMGQTTLGGWSKMFGCEQGVGCLECGGLGVIWESEDYENMAEWMRQEDKKEAGRKAELTALRARAEKAEEELAVTKREHNGAMTEMQHEYRRAEKAEANLTALRARVAELEAVVVKLREAIKRFAEVAEWDIGDNESDSDTYRPMDPRYSVSGNISIGHLRRAHEVMEETDWVADKIRAQQTNDAALKKEPTNGNT